MEKFNQSKYIRSYIKEHKSTFSVDLNKDEMIDLNEMLKMYNLSKAQFLRNSIYNFKEEKKMKKYLVHSNEYSCTLKGNDWYYNGDVTYSNFENNKIFNNIEDATKFYDEIELNDNIDGNYRYSSYKILYEINNDITEDDLSDLDLDTDADIIKCDYIFTDYR